MKSGAALVLYLITMVFTPIAHAQTQHEFGAASFEAAHTTQCLPLHDEAVCVSCGSHSSIGTLRITLSVVSAQANCAVVLSRETPAPSDPAETPPPARAPPLR